MPNDGMWSKYIALREELRLDVEQFVGPGAYRGAPPVAKPLTPADRERLRAKIQEVFVAFHDWLDSE